MFASEQYADGMIILDRSMHARVKQLYDVDLDTERHADIAQVSTKARATPYNPFPMLAGRWIPVSAVGTVLVRLAHGSYPETRTSAGYASGPSGASAHSAGNPACGFTDRANLVVLLSGTHTVRTGPGSCDAIRTLGPAVSATHHTHAHLAVLLVFERIFDRCVQVFATPSAIKSVL
jgi:hypothetical protein